MAKNLNYKQSRITNLSVKGLLNAEGKEVTYVDENKEEQTVMVSDLIEKFAGKGISLTIKEQVEEELPIEE